MRSYSHLSEDERDQIGVLRAAGRSIGAIARALCRAKTTVSRELQRNALPSAGIRRFTPTEPINCAGGVKRSSTRGRCTSVVGDRLAEGWTPRTDLRLVEIRQRTVAAAIGCETIYAFIIGPHRGRLCRHLTCRHKRRRPRRARPVRDTIRNRASIDDRPKTNSGDRAQFLNRLAHRWLPSDGVSTTTHL